MFVFSSSVFLFFVFLRLEISLLIILIVELISSYLNGSRTLSDEKMSYLVISRPANANTEQKEEGTYSLLFCAPHYIGDGSSLHQCTHELFVLLTNSNLSAPIEQDKVHWVLIVFTGPSQ